MESAGPRKARICHIITLLELGGAQQNTLHTAAHLDRRRFQVSLVAGRGGQLDAEAAAMGEIDTHFLPELVREVNPANDFRALVRLTVLLRRLQPDLVHTHSSKAGIVGRWAAHLAGVPVVVHTIHGFGFHPAMPFARRELFRLLESWTTPITTRFIAVSRANLEAGARAGLLRPQKATLVRSGVALAAFRNGATPGSLRSELGIPAQAPVVGMVACLKPQKAPVDFVKVAQQVARTLPQAHFLLVGDGELRGEVEAQVLRGSLTGRFHLLGWRRDIPSIFKNLNLLALTSLWEGLPRVVPEAMAASLPVVATRVDGTPEAVMDGVTGFLVQPGDVGGMAGKIVWLLQHPDEAKAMGRKGSEQVGEFDIEVMVRRQEELYDELLAARVEPYAGLPELPGPATPGKED